MIVVDVVFEEEKIFGRFDVSLFGTEVEKEWFCW